MTPRKALFSTTSPAAAQPGGLVSSAVPFTINKTKGALVPMSPEQKAICALRLVLSKMTGRGEPKYFISSDKVRFTKMHVSPGSKADEPGTYSAEGRCQAGVSLPCGSAGFKMIAFQIAFRDAVDDMGLPTVEYTDANIDELPHATAL